MFVSWVDKNLFHNIKHIENTWTKRKLSRSTANEIIFIDEDKF